MPEDYVYRHLSPNCPVCLVVGAPPQNNNMVQRCKRHKDRNGNLLRIVHPACPNHANHPLLVNEESALEAK